MLKADVPASRGASALSISVREGVVSALVATTLVLILHHLAPLSGHALVTVIGVFAGTFLAAALVSGALAGRRLHSPAVVVVGPGDSQVRSMQDEDLPFCGELHAQALGHGFFVWLGPAFMRAYHRTFLESPHAVALTSVVRGHRVGFLVGALQPRAHARWVLRHRAGSLLLRGAAAIVVRPQVAVRFLQTRVRRYASAWRRHRRELPGDAPRPDSNSATAVLSHVAVLPGARGTGVGRELVRTFEAVASGAGASRATLTTLGGAAGGGRFYAALGWTRRGSGRSADGEQIDLWTRLLDGQG